jgi:hypothetical protein
MFVFNLISHWVGDYLLQAPLKYKGQSVAVIKRENSVACLIHVLIYTLCFLPLCLYTCNYWYVVLILIGLSHFFQDRFWFPMKYFMEKAKELTYVNGFYEKNSLNDKFEFKEIKYINSATWYPILYIVYDNGYHLFFNYFILILFMK